MATNTSTAGNPETSKSSSQGGLPPTKIKQISKALTLLHNQLKKAITSKSEHTEVKSSPEALNPANEILRYCRQHSAEVPSSLAVSIATELDNGGYEFCSRLSAEVFSVIMQTIIQAEYTLVGERGLHLLAGSLYYDSTSRKGTLLGRKATIGECLLQLLDFFTITEYHNRMRKWAGILCLQLLQDCDNNRKRIEMGAEQIRRRLGNLVLCEKNEITRLICGHLIRVILDTTNIERKNLWPAESDSVIYAGFPEAGFDWKTRFQRFVDEGKQLMGSMSPNTEATGTLYFGMDVVTLPAHDFESLGHNVVISVESEYMSFWAASVEGTNRFEQSLEIPLNNISSMSIESGCSTQEDTSKVLINLISLPGHFCYVDCKPYRVTRLTMLMMSTGAQEMENSIIEHNPQIKILQDDHIGQEETDSYRQYNLASQQSHHSNHSQEPIKLGTRRADEATIKLRDGTGRNSPSKVGPVIQEEEANPVARTSRTSGIIDSQPQVKPTQETETVYLNDKQSSLPTRYSKSQRQTATKSKAKPPLRQSRRFGENSVSTQVCSTVPMSSPIQSKPSSVTSGPVVFEQTMEDKMRNVGDNFPHVGEPTLRGALVVSKGNIEDAISFLNRSAELATTPEDHIKFKGGHIEPYSIKSPWPKDASTPKATNMPGSEVSTKPLAEANRSQRLYQKLATTKNDAGSLSKATHVYTTRVVSAKDYIPSDVELLKSQTKKRKLASEEPYDGFEIPEDPVAKKSMATEPKSKTLGKSMLKPSAKPLMKANEVKPKPAARSYKRKSASARLRQDLKVIQTQRSAALASQKSRDADMSEDEIDEEQILFLPLQQEATRTETGTNLTSHVLENANKVGFATRLEKQNQVLETQRQIRSSAIGNNDPPGPDIDDLYDATPVKVTKKHNRLGNKQDPVPIGMKRNTKSLGDMASTMNKLFGDPGAETGKSSEKYSVPKEASGRTEITKVELNMTTKQEVDGQIDTAYEVIERPAPEVETRNEDNSPMGIFQKQKALDSTMILSKRQRAIKQSSPVYQSLVRRSPRIAAKKHTHTKITQKGGEGKSVISPSRSSDRLKAELTGTQIVENDTPVSKNLTDDYLARKQQIISFGVQGARNQGPSSVVKESANRAMKTTPEAVVSLILKESSELKRKMGTTNLKETLPMKKQKSINSLEDLNFQTDDVQGFTSSPPQPQQLPPPGNIMNQDSRFSQPPSLVPRRSSGLSRPHSQKSHVNENGSPIGSSQVDHISKAKQKLWEDDLVKPEIEEVQSPSPRAPLFGPKLKLSGITKARPSSPVEVISHYVPHQKTANGLYKGIRTGEVIVEEKILADPFQENMVRISNNNFTTRLVAEVTAQQTDLRQQRPPMALKHLKHNDGVFYKHSNHAPDMPRRVEPKTVTEGENKNSIISTASLDKEPTLLNVENMPPSDSSPDDITSGSSSDSRSALHSESPSECSKSAESEIDLPGGGWDVALRPYYSNLSDAIHRIADEVIIRLSKEEDVVGLLVDQYKDGGTKILDNHSRLRNNQKAHMGSEICEKRLEFANAYTNARDRVEMRKHGIIRSPVSNFEKIWKQEQDSIQARLSQIGPSSL